MAGYGLQGVLQRALDLPRGVAREGGWSAAGPGSPDSPRDAAGRWAGRDTSGGNGVRAHRLDRVGAGLFRTLIALGLAVLAPTAADAYERIRSLRVWPSQDYTRITIETEAELRYELTALKNPERLVLDLENVDFLSIVDQSAKK